MLLAPNQSRPDEDPMHRLSGFLAASAVAALVFAGVGQIPAASAVDPLTGRVVDGTVSSHPGIGNMTIQLREVGSSGVGPVVASDVTNGSGAFSLNAGPSPDDEYFVRVVPGSYQGGYIGGDSPAMVQPTPGFATTYGPHAHVGPVWANPAFIRGVVVNAATGAPVPGAYVTARDSADITAVEAHDTTNSNGVFRASGITCEDSCFLKINGSGVGYETGFRDCGGTVVATWGAACASPIGRIGKVRLDRL
jgi:hypothetical protein